MMQQKPFRFSNYREYVEELNKQNNIEKGFTQTLFIGFQILEGAMLLQYSLKGNNEQMLKQGLTQIFTSLATYIEIMISSDIARDNIYTQLEEALWFPQYTVTSAQDETLMLYNKLLTLSSHINTMREKGAMPTGHTVFIRNTFPSMFKHLVSICLHYSLPPLAVLHDGLKEKPLTVVKQS